jgi:Domain of unknown function (DUF4190)
MRRDWPTSERSGYSESRAGPWRLELADMGHPDAPRNQVGVASVILGAVALGSCWLLIGVPLGIAAVITGDVARRRVQRREANNPRAATAGIVLGAVAIVAGLVAVGYYAWLDSQKP